VVPQLPSCSASKPFVAPFASIRIRRARARKSARPRTLGLEAARRRNRFVSAQATPGADGSWIGAGLRADLRCSDSLLRRPGVAPSIGCSGMGCGSRRRLSLPLGGPLPTVLPRLGHDERLSRVSAELMRARRRFSRTNWSCMAVAGGESWLACEMRSALAMSSAQVSAGVFRARRVWCSAGQERSQSSMASMRGEVPPLVHRQTLSVMNPAWFHVALAWASSRRITLEMKWNGGNVTQTEQGRMQSNDNSRQGFVAGTTEARPGLITTEFFLTLVASVLVVIAAYIDDGIADRLGWILLTAIVGAYVLSRGIAKAGSREGPFMASFGDGQQR
jgi:hypothetical protein